MVWQVKASVSAELQALIGAGCPVIYVETWEEERLEKTLRDLSPTVDLPVWTWSSSQGLDDGSGAKRDLRDPFAALESVLERDANALCLFTDLPDYLVSDAGLRRLVRDSFDKFSAQRGNLVMSFPSFAVPEDLSRELHYYRLPLADREEIVSYLESLNSTLPATEGFSQAWIASCAHEMKGLTINTVTTLFQRLCHERLDERAAAHLIQRERAQALMKESSLEWVENDLSLDAIGGLRALKAWIESRKKLFEPQARAAGIDPPGGVLMMGVSGCGKSLAAKVIARAWSLPLIRLDMNLIMSGAWGSPERAWSRALATIESVAPAVVWIDEIEDSFGYVNGQATGGNLTIFSSFLTWMQEKQRDVFVVATANNVDLLPAEMLRKGRFDELFFLDLPKADARAEILRIHIAANGGDPADFDTQRLAELLDGWTAAEIEQLVRAARLEAFCQDRQFTFVDVKDISFKMVPLSKTMAEQINALRRWARSRAVAAD